jgi:phosphoribosylformylglycinamidine synthase
MAVVPAALPTDPPITAHVLEQHKISKDEYARIESILGRAPTFTELGVFSVMWSEHCSYKSSRVHLRRLYTKGPRVIQGPGENAGVVDIGDGFAAVFKMESHNHPSYIEPYQGAATGVGGILRDVFTMGARPIASLDSLRFGRPDHPRTPELLRGVVAGIGGYGNCVGVPTVGGELMFDAAYDGNILVNVFTCGVARTDRIFYGRAAGVGNPILYIGARTGRDGIHGATMASDEFEEGKQAQRPTMQVGDPFMEKLLLEACLELFAMDVLEGIQDMGAAGLTSSSTEMAARAGTGLEIDLDLVPRRAKGMLPYEILLSESQERMLLVARKGLEQQVLDVCKKWEIDAAVIGRVTDTKRWVVKATPGYDPLASHPIATNPVVVCDIPISAVADEAPVYDRPRKKAEPKREATSIPHVALTSNAFAQEILDACGSPNLGSRSWVFRQFDHVVRGGTIVRPGSDAAVVRAACTTRDGREIQKLFAFAVDCNARMCEIDPYVGGAMAVAECCRNIVCAGAEPIGLTDCLNFGNPERPEIMEQLARAIDGIADACRALDVPIVSGNVSLYNETTSAGVARAILPTPTIGGVGLLASEKHIITSAFKKDGDVVLLLGAFPVVLPEDLARVLAGSEWLSRKTGRFGGPIAIDLGAEARLQRLVLGLAREGVLSSAHDVSEGGLAVCLAECCTTGETDMGADLFIGGPAETWIGTMFGEAPSRIVVSVPTAHERAVTEAAARAGVEAHRLGVVTSRPVLRLSGTVPCEVGSEAIRAARESCLDAIVHR